MNRGTGMPERRSYDAVIVGGGIAGLVAGVSAAELGLAVAVLEKGTTPQYLCNSRISGGVFHIALHNPKLPREELVRAIDARTEGTADSALAETLAARAGGTMDWLIGHGARFIKGGAQEGHALVAAPPRPTAQNPDWLQTWSGRGPDMLLRTLTDRLARFGGSLRLGTQARELIMSNGRCAGVDAIVDGVTKRFEASAVVLADGGFQANREMLGTHIGRFAGGIRQRNTETGTGDGIRMAQAVGAALTRMDRFYGHLLSRDALANDRLWPYPLIDDLAVSGIVVDQSGKRFADEGCGGVYIANAIANGREPLFATVICDTPIWEGPGRKARISANPHLHRCGGTLHAADSLPTLAVAADLPPESLVATVERYNRACLAVDFDSLEPGRSVGRYKPMPVAHPPFLAIPVCAGITYTMGGIQIDSNARVLRPDGSAIPGLYAAGTTTGGIEGGARAYYVGGLMRASVFAKQAAEHIVALHARQESAVGLGAPS